MPIRPENIARLAWSRYQLSGDGDSTLEQLTACLKRNGVRRKTQAEVWRGWRGVPVSYCIKCGRSWVVVMAIRTRLMHQC
jgi:hypothetical protein